MTRKTKPLVPVFLPPVDPELLERLAARFAPEHRRADRPNPEDTRPRNPNQEGTTTS